MTPLVCCRLEGLQQEVLSGRISHQLCQKPFQSSTYIMGFKINQLEPKNCPYFEKNILKLISKDKTYCKEVKGFVSKPTGAPVLELDLLISLTFTVTLSVTLGTLPSSSAQKQKGGRVSRWTAVRFKRSMGGEDHQAWRLELGKQSTGADAPCLPRAGPWPGARWTALRTERL